MSAAVPWGDPQFWMVSAAALAALAYVLRRLFRFRRRGEVELPCENCSQAKPRRGVGAYLRRKIAGGKAPLGVLLALSLAAPVDAETLEREVVAMGTTLSMEIDATDRAAALALSERIVAAIAEAESRLSTWRDDSELARFNTLPSGESIELSPFTAAALDAAVDCWRESGGAFDPTIAPLVEAWGLRTGGRRPGAAEIARARAALDAGALDAARGARHRSRPAGVRVEEGGFGKGAALDLALGRVGDAAVRLDFGGQLAWAGTAGPTVVQLADPRDRGRPVLELAIPATSGSLSTSGNSERGLVVAGERIGHLLDPRTGEPAADFGSATVFAASATVADCRSTALYVLGPERGRSWLAATGASGVLLVVENDSLRALVGSALAPGARALVPELAIEKIPSS